jgi:hypothetical protein
LLQQMKSCAFHIFLTSQIWLHLTSDYLGVLKPPLRGKFDEPEQLLGIVTECLDTISVGELRPVFTNE